MRTLPLKRADASFLGAAIGLLAMIGCSSPGAKKSMSAPPEVSADALESKARLAAEKTAEDERRAPKIQREMNGLFFHGKKINPGGLDAFSDERLAELDSRMKESKSEEIAYYLENRKYFERVEDAGGGFRVVTNGKRLLPYLKTRTGRKKLFQMDRLRVLEMTANPCFSALEDCGEEASDGEENTALLDEWTRKYPEEEFRGEREKVLRTYLAALAAYERKFAKRSKPVSEAKDPRKFRSGKEALLYIGNHRRGIESLLAE